jgi:hypothetical protein
MGPHVAAETCMTTRRTLLAAAATALAVRQIGCAQAQAAVPAALTSGHALCERAAAFLARLSPAHRQAATFPWQGEPWRRWDYFGASGYVKAGLRLEQMSSADKDRAWDLFAEVLSPLGLAKARHVMLLQDVLMADGDGVGQRHRERFSVSFHGTPATTGAWGLRLEGHHLSLSFAVRDGALVSVTPSAFAARPARVAGGPHAGLMTLEGEEMLARRLMADLPPPLLKFARVRDSKLFNILSSAGQERANSTKLGLRAADMSAGQRDLLWQLVETYAVMPFAGALAARQRDRIREGDPMAVSFAWYGPNTEGQGFGYRVIGDTFVIELGSIDGAGQHLHPIYHDLGNVLGRAA